MSDVKQYIPKEAISLTPAACGRARELLAKEPGSLGIRLAVKKDGCSGYKYDLSFVTEAQKEDKIFQVAEDVAIYVDSESLFVITGTQLDYIQEGVNWRFVYRNPNEKTSCGCGESFGV